jgi:hypothetical protein
MNRLLPVIAILLSMGISACTSSPEEATPPNTPAQLIREGNSLTLSYAGNEIMRLTTDLSPDAFTVKELKEEHEGKISHLFTVSAVDGGSMNISGIIRAGKESFTCEADRRIEGTQVVRHTFGLSHSLLNRAVYDRGRTGFSLQTSHIHQPHCVLRLR